MWELYFTAIKRMGVIRMQVKKNLPVDSNVIKQRQAERRLNSLLRSDVGQNYRILLRMVQRLSQHNLKITHNRHI
jgi:hypothetical protein